MTWLCEDPADLERLNLGLRLADSRTLAQPQPELRARMPLRYRVLGAVMSALFRQRVRSYHLNLFQIEGPKTM
jgi:hypothetical protein